MLGGTNQELSTLSFCSFQFLFTYNTMTYEQIEKEFDEYYDTYNADKGGLLYPNQTKAQVKSFLKQSFIKYLKDEVEACNQYKTFYNPVGDEFNKGKHKAMDDRVERLQAQIKELEG